MTEFISFFIVLLAAVFFSAIFNRLHLPWVIALITAGIAIGPFALDIYDPGPTIEFLGEIGLVFLMFVAGLETRLSAITRNARSISVLALLGSLLPAAAGILIGLQFGYSLQTSLLLGIIFISTSIAVVVPSLEARNLFHTRLGNVIVGATIVEDIASLALLSFMLQSIERTAILPLWIFYPLLLLSLIGVRLIVPRLRALVTYGRHGKDLFQQELRLVVLLLLGAVIVFELLGLHSIIAGFFAGLILSEIIKSSALLEKIRAISYGLFIPIFFVLIGTKTDLSVFWQAQSALALTAAIIFGSVATKFVSGYLAGYLDNFTFPQRLLMGAATTPSLSTTLAVAFTGLSTGLLDQTIVTALVLLSIVTSITGPGTIALLSKRAASAYNSS